MRARALPHAFADCAHWWALARHALIALDAIHELHLVHLDLKADNVCIPWARSDSAQAGLGHPAALRFGELALIDFAFALSVDTPLQRALPLGLQGEGQQLPRGPSRLRSHARPLSLRLDRRAHAPDI